MPSHTDNMNSSMGKVEPAEEALQRRAEYTRGLLQKYQKLKRKEASPSGHFWDLLVLSAGDESQR